MSKKKRKAGPKKKKKALEKGKKQPLDMKLMERLLREKPTGEKNTALRKAQELIDDAWEIVDPGERAKMALDALRISRDCVDAFVILAQDVAATDKQAGEFYRMGVEQGEKALGEKYFSDNAGHFWGLHETRPYMRARVGLAQCLWQEGQRDECIEHCREMLKLNPGDNQGIRYLLMPYLLEKGRDGEARELMIQYGNEPSASWSYSAVLLAFRKEGASADSNGLLDRAIKVNPHVPDFLLGRKKMPEELPGFYSPHEESEAVFYVSGNESAWKKTSGALDWLKRCEGQE